MRSVTEKSTFAVSLRFELFYALNTLLNPHARIHGKWVQQTRERLPPSFYQMFKSIGGAWEIWSVMPAMISNTNATPSCAEILYEIRSLPIETFAQTFLSGFLHSTPAVNALLKERVPLALALKKVPKAKLEWLGHIGLYPCDAKAPMVIAFEALLKNPEGFRRTVLELIELFWNSTFAATWSLLTPQLERSKQEKERLFASCSLTEFFQEALIRVNIDDSGKMIAAVRGGYKIPEAKIQSLYFLPSAFNDRRYWSAVGEDRPPVVAYFPYFDPSITLLLQSTGRIAALEAPAYDPALILKALGDTTRFAIARIIAEAPQTSVELAKRLAVSKPTISHHIGRLRDAGLLLEEHLNGSVRLSLNRDIIDQLSSLIVGAFYNSNPDNIEIKRSRKQVAR